MILSHIILSKVFSQRFRNQPQRCFEHLGYPSTFGQVETVYDELVVMQDRWVELNGNTLEREVYTEDEFYGDLPVGGFKPVEAAMSYSANLFVMKMDIFICTRSRLQMIFMLEPICLFHCGIILDSVLYILYRSLRTEIWMRFWLSVKRITHW